jgi:hypothetical protein
MHNLRRQSLLNIESKERDILLKHVLDFILDRVRPVSVVAFGSVASSRFDAWSDIDVVVILATKEEVRESRKKLHIGRPTVPCPVEILCVGLDDYERKSQIGGVFFEAKNSGRILWSNHLAAGA